MNVRDLSIKCSLYAHFIASREWAREDVRIPQLLCVAPAKYKHITFAASYTLGKQISSRRSSVFVLIGQEKRMQRVTQARLSHTLGLVIWTTTEVLLKEHGPLAPIWLPGAPDCKQASLPGSWQRYRLHQLIPVSRAM